MRGAVLRAGAGLGPRVEAHRDLGPRALSSGTAAPRPTHANRPGAGKAAAFSLSLWYWFWDSDCCGARMDSQDPRAAPPAVRASLLATHSHCRALEQAAPPGSLSPS